MSGKASLVLGGGGQLGRKMVDQFRKNGWRTLSMDFQKNPEATENILVNSKEPLKNQAGDLLKQAQNFSDHYDSIIIVAGGGFQASNIADDNILEKWELQDKGTFQSALLGGHIASRTLGENGLLIFPGAAGVFEGSVNFAYAYALAKSTTHALALQMATRQEIPESATVVTILPGVIDTPFNRATMPGSDTSKWLPPTKMAELLLKWSEGEDRPVNGAFAKLEYSNKMIVPEYF